MKIIKLVNNASVHCLVKRWGERYVPDLSVLSCPEASQLIGIACLEGRAKTVAKLQRVMQLNCECAGIKTDVLFSYIPNVVNLSESQRLAHYVWQVYEKVLELYKQQSPSPVTLATVSSRFAGTTDFSSDFLTKWAMPMLEMPDIEQLAMVTAPVLQQLQAQHRLTSDSRAIGFISTQFHFSTELIFKRLTHLEQVLLSPYFKFVEEQVCIPLQRVCQAAAQHPPDSPSLAIVQHLLPLSQEIASSVYRRSQQLYPTYRSRRGGLSHPGVMASTIRDLQMLQAYLWLCVLEESMAAIKEELLPLCIMVFPSVEVSWTLVRQMLQLLGDELLKRVERQQKYHLLPYVQGMQQLFSEL